MGTHPSGPATLAVEPSKTLKEWIQANPSALGDTVLKRFGVDLPYLFKVGQQHHGATGPVCAKPALSLASGTEFGQQLMHSSMVPAMQQLLLAGSVLSLEPQPEA